MNHMTKRCKMKTPANPAFFDMRQPMPGTEFPISGQEKFAARQQAILWPSVEYLLIAKGFAFDNPRSRVEK